MCERCQNPNRATHEYTVHKGDSKRKATLCDDCARTYIDADIKLTGGKREAEPEASTEVSEGDESTSQAKPARRR
jgi:protein-arginine kinase activator protein McsA